MLFILFMVTVVLQYAAAEHYKTKLGAGDMCKNALLLAHYWAYASVCFLETRVGVKIYHAAPMRIASFINTCMKSDPDFDDCSKDAVQKLFNALGPGLPEIDLPPIDPLNIPKLRILQGEGPVNVNAALENVVVTGFGRTEVLLSQVDSKNYDFYTKVRVPKIRIEGTYDLKGKILLIPLVGSGLCWFEPSNMTIDIVSDVKLYEKNNLPYFNVTQCHVKYNIGGLKLYMSNLFDGISSLEDSTNAYLNANWRPVSESLRPILSKTIEDILLAFMQQIFHNLPANFMIGDLKSHFNKKIENKEND